MDRESSDISRMRFRVTRLDGGGCCVEVFGRQRLFFSSQSETVDMVWSGSGWLLLVNIALVASVNWLEWWTYDGISGPSFWGLINPEWSLCNQGLRYE